MLPENACPVLVFGYERTAGFLPAGVRGWRGQAGCLRYEHAHASVGMAPRALRGDDRAVGTDGSGGAGTITLGRISISARVTVAFELDD